MPGVASAPSSLLSLRHHRFSCLTPPPTGSFISPPVCRACEEEKERKEERKVEKGGDNTFVRCRKCGRVYHMKVFFFFFFFSFFLLFLTKQTKKK